MRNVREGDHHRLGLEQSRRGQRLAPARVAVDDDAAVRSRHAHALRIGIEREVGNVLRLEQARQILAAAAIAADDDVILPRHGLGGDLRHLRRARQPVVGRQLAHDRLGILDDERRRQHRQDHRGQDRLRELPAESAGCAWPAPASPARVRLPAPGRSRCAMPSTAASRTARASATMSSELGEDRYQQQQRNQAQIRRDDLEVEHHADRDEEKTEQHVAERLDVVLDLVAVLGLRDQHAGDESAQRQRQPEQLRSAHRGPA